MTIRRTITAAALVAAAGALSACEGGMANPFAVRATTETYAPVSTEEAFRAQVVGREVVYENGAIGTYGEDGSWAIADGSGILASGTWTWQDGQWCYEGASASGPVPRSCDDVEVSASGVRFTRADGTTGTLPFRT